MTATPKRFIHYIVTTIATLVVIEGMLTILAWTSSRVAQLLAPPWTTVPDQRLGHRPSPGIRDHDGRGWRNPKTLKDADIVALGDSQTYGVNVGADEAWPRQLQAMISKSVYSMAYGGYGPAHSLALWDEATDLHPRIVIEAFYAGNDLFDSFDIVYNRNQLPNLKSTEDAIQQQILDAEKAEPLTEHIGRMFHMGSALAFGVPHTTTPVSQFSLKTTLSERSSIYGLFRRARYEIARDYVPAQPEITWEAAKAFAKQNSPYCEILLTGEFRTILTPAYRLSAVDLTDVRIAEGLRVSLKAIKAMQELSAAQGIKLIVVLIPTKEYVFQHTSENLSRSYAALIKNEEQLWREAKDYFDRLGIAYVDTLPAFREELTKHVQPYQITEDGHPNQYGHRAIAQAVASFLKRLSPGQDSASAEAALGVR